MAPLGYSRSPIVSYDMRCEAVGTAALSWTSKRNSLPTPKVAQWTQLVSQCPYRLPRQIWIELMCDIMTRCTAKLVLVSVSVGKQMLRRPNNRGIISRSLACTPYLRRLCISWGQALLLRLRRRHKTGKQPNECTPWKSVHVWPERCVFPNHTPCTLSLYSQPSLWLAWACVVVHVCCHQVTFN